jgi:hypothetical protein
LRCLLGNEFESHEPGHLLFRMHFRDEFQLHGASTLRIGVLVEGIAGKPDVVSSYLCSTSEKLGTLVIRSFKVGRIGLRGHGQTFCEHIMKLIVGTSLIMSSTIPIQA